MGSGQASALEFVRALDAAARGRERRRRDRGAHRGSASAKPGAKAIIDAQGRTVFGWVGGGCAESSVRDVAREVLASRSPQLIRLDLDDEVLGVGMPCGGYMEIYVEAMAQSPKLVVLGHGKIAETLVAFGHALGFQTIVNDAPASAGGLPAGRPAGHRRSDYAKVECDAETYVVIATQHKSDYEALQRVLAQSPAWGWSRAASAARWCWSGCTRTACRVEKLRRVAAPAGLDIGSETLQEIALSILSEIVQVARGGASSGRSLMAVKGVRITDAGVEVPEGPLESAKSPT
jgi:xanthine dehydrogenase accessory factor